MQETFAIQGKKVVLRLLVASDLCDYERWNDNTRPSMQTDGPWYDEDLSKMIAGRRQRLATGQQPPYRSLEIDTTDGTHIGWVNFYHNADNPHASEAGIHIAEHDYWGRGLGTEALALWVDYLFHAWSLYRLGMTTWSGNPGMIRSAHKLGFMQEGCRRQGCNVKGNFYDIIELGLLREEWESSLLEVWLRTGF